MAVAQGETMDEIVQCFAELRGKVDRVGISFNCAAYEDYFEKMGQFDPERHTELEKLEVWKKGRHMFMEILYNLGLLEDTEVHLLGVALPDEFKYYTTEHKALERPIKSLDTSNPVVHGLLGIRYSSENGLDQKQSIKLAEMIDMPQSKISLKNMQLIMYNLDTFRSLNHLPRPIPGMVQG